MTFIPTEHNLVSLKMAKTYLKLDLADQTDDEILTTLIGGISQQIVHYTGRDLVQKTYQEKFNGHGKGILFVTHYPINCVLALYIDNTVIDAAKTAHGIGYRLSDTALYLNGMVFKNGWQNIELTYTAGYLTLPADITLACLWLIEEAFHANNTPKAASQSLAGQSITWRPSRSDDVIAQLLKPFRRVI